MRKALIFAGVCVGLVLLFYAHFLLWTAERQINLAISISAIQVTQLYSEVIAKLLGVIAAFLMLILLVLVIQNRK